jgi:hypothetical protein
MIKETTTVMMVLFCLKWYPTKHLLLYFFEAADSPLGAPLAEIRENFTHHLLAVDGATRDIIILGNRTKLICINEAGKLLSSYLVAISNVK